MALPGLRREGRTPQADRQHPVHVFAGRLLEVLDDVAAAPAFGMGRGEAAEAIVELEVGLSRLRALRLAALAQADRVEVGSVNDATSTAAWLRSQVPVTGAAATRDVQLAQRLDLPQHSGIAIGLAGGRLLGDQAIEILDAVDALPDRIGADERAMATEFLLEQAQVHDAKALRALGRHLLAVIAPDVAEEELATRLEREEAEAAKATKLTMGDDGHGKTHGRFTIPSLHGAMLRKLLEAIANPGRPDPITRRGGPQVMGEAFTELIERYPMDPLATGTSENDSDSDKSQRRIPAALSNRINATVVVTIPLATLMGGLATAAVLGTEIELSPATARRLACAAGVVPAVLDGKGRVLDLGRRSRLASTSQRLAKHVEQGGFCGIEHCERPASWADAHHWRQRWADGSSTNLDDLVLICPRHHTLAHLPGRSLQPHQGGTFRIIRRT